MNRSFVECILSSKRSDWKAAIKYNCPCSIKKWRKNFLSSQVNDGHSPCRGFSTALADLILICLSRNNKTSGAYHLFIRAACNLRVRILLSKYTPNDF